MEMTVMKEEDAQKRYNETIWKFLLFDADAGDGTVIKSKKHMIFITNVNHNVAVHTFKQPLPEWAFNMQEINGNKKILENSNRWTVINVTHPNIGMTFGLVLTDC
jgi:dolichyl-phosphate-mannose-protein mannosyltransferase